MSEEQGLTEKSGAEEVPGIWRNPAFRAYIGANSTTHLAFSMQYLLISWLLIGVLETEPDNVGFAHALIGIPGLFLMLWGGASADRGDSRGLLMRIYALAGAAPLLLMVAHELSWLTYWTVTGWALLMSVASSFANPAQSAILNRSAGSQVQQAVTAATAAGFVVQVAGLVIAGRLEVIGLSAVLAVQSVAIFAGSVLIRQIPPLPTGGEGAEARRSVVRSVLEGLAATGRDRLLTDVLALNFVSMMFNAGSFMLVLPFIVMRVYDGDAAVLAWMLVVFFVGGSLSNFLMLRFMPLRYPGRGFLLMQATRVVIFVLLWVQPPQWLLLTAIFLWGMNMGITTTLSRTIVQESAPAQYRARILSVYSIGILGAQPLGALILGWVTASLGILNGLLPGMLTSAFILVYGMLASGIWAYESPQYRQKELEQRQTAD